MDDRLSDGDYRQLVELLVETASEAFAGLPIHPDEHRFGTDEGWLCDYPFEFPMAELTGWCIDPRCRACLTRIEAACRNDEIPHEHLWVGFYPATPELLLDVMQGVFTRFAADPTHNPRRPA